MKAAINVNKCLYIELDKLGILLNTTCSKPEKIKKKLEAVIHIPFESIEDKDFIRNKVRVFAEQISKKISEVHYMAIEENSIKDTDDVVVKVLVLE